MSTLSQAVKIGLHIYGIRPHALSTIPSRVYWIVMLTTAQIFQYRYVANSNTDDFSDFMDGVSSALASSLLYIKLIILWINQRIFFDILQMMDADWRDHISNNYSMRVMTNTANHAHRASRWIINMQVFAVITYSIGVLASNANNPEELKPSARELILKMALPFNIDTYLVYVIVTVIQFYHLMLVGYGITIVNSLLVTIILHVCGQIDIFRECVLQTLSQNTTQSVDEITLQSLIKKHQQVILFSENIENLYTYIAFMILLSDTIMICCLGYIIVTSIGTPNGAAILVKSMLFYISINLEAFIYCFSGEYLSAKSKMIGDAAYNSPWYNLEIRKIRVVLFIILRSQKQLVITSGKVMDLCLERFTSVMKASASYISVLLAMY